MRPFKILSKTNLKSFSAILLTACGFGAMASPASAETFPFSFLKCGEISCADVYQGEGVDYPQLVVHIFPKGGGQNSIDYTYIADYDPAGDGAFQLYFGNTLVEHHSPNAIVYLPETFSDAISPHGILLSEGLELAFNSPYTADFDWWPTQSVIQEIVQQSVNDIPSSIIAWDNQNGGGSPDDDGAGTGSGGMSGQAVGGLADPRRLCQIMSPDGEGVCTDQAVGNFSVGGLTAVVSPEATAAAIRARFAPVLAASRMAPLARLNRSLAASQSTADGGPPQPSNCSNLALVNSYASGGLAACFESCDLCVQQDMEQWTFDVGTTCGEVGVEVAILTALATEGLAIPGAVGIATAVGGSCAGLFLNNLSSMRMIRRKSCLDTCEYLDALANN